MPQDEYLETKRITTFSRLPLEGQIDLTYRCNNNCRHCWLYIPPDSKERKDELTFEEIKKIVDEAKSMGCRRWFISGGEPMLRPDFAEIFDYITRRSRGYSLNTNGALITFKIARLLKRKGYKMVALYGATAGVHDHITRNPGSFEQTIRGCRYLKEAGAGFTVQLIPMKDNYHQFRDMLRLSESLSKSHRIGSPWLHLSACADAARNREIMRQRLPPREVVDLDQPDLSYEDWERNERGGCGTQRGGGLFSSCVRDRLDFHIDSYGKMSFCALIKDPRFRYDVKKGSLKECWEEFIPSLAHKVKATREYRENCGSCELADSCRWCPVFGYLEHGRFSAKVSYLCAVARENKKFKQDWLKNHRRYFKIADITIQVESDLPFNDKTFHPKFRHFEAPGPSDDMITIRHHFALPDLRGKDPGLERYRKPPWAVYQKGSSWVYVGIAPSKGDRRVHKVAVFDSGHRSGRIYHATSAGFLRGGLHALTLLPSDQILLARMLAEKQGLYLHSCGVKSKGKGYLLVGNSGAGKSTAASLLRGSSEILCDDRMIVRKTSGGIKVYGTWNHGDVPDVSSASAPLRAILFLNKSKQNYAHRLNDKKLVVKKLLTCLIKPFVTADWWEKTLGLIEDIADEVPCYDLYFDKSDRIVETIKALQ
jgi:MoaA/NifB/PqqE/SkfB family radical SAM enzyme